mmetsp:Transcript_64285/g.76094  ORF Transcript_64285/g.76094 Transcript_64285/m.76094 type:complete len:97 (+) Transcript_64285:151-441(+)
MTDSVNMGFEMAIKSMNTLHVLKETNIKVNEQSKARKEFVTCKEEEENEEFDKEIEEFEEVEEFDDGVAGDIVEESNKGQQVEPVQVVKPSGPSQR